MAGLRKDLLTSLIAVILMTLAFGLAYPLAITGIAQVVFPGSANGSKVSFNGKVVGSKLIGQSFSEPQIGKNGKPVLDEEGEEVLVANPVFFQPRPSATEYSGDVTFFGNAGPNSAELRDAIRENLAAYVKLNKPYDRSLTREQVPVDAVTESASGVDPQISEANARIQAHRIAAVRHLSLDEVEALISDHTDDRSLGVLGEPGVNVLQLNIALEEKAPLSAERGQRPYLTLRNRAKRERDSG
jgi:K+-transporting ATPase ATPase C chain